jgi:uncharacterized DUF497 family protein
VPPTVISADGSYEWDAVKDAANIRKHEVGFAEAAQALEYPYRKTFDDGSRAGRLRGIGYATVDRLLTVVFEAGGERDRIISAWRSTRAERRLFMASATDGG